MRSVGKLVLALALVLSVASSANAAAFVWAQLGAGSSPGVAAVADGASGTTLVLTKPNTPGTYTINLDIMVRSDAAAATQGVTGYRTVFLKDAADADLSLAGAVSTNPMAWSGTSNAGTAVNGAGGILVDTIGHSRSGTQTPISAGNSPKLIYTMSLTIVKQGGVVAGAEHKVWAAVAAGLWGAAPIAGNTVSFGPNAGAAGATAIDTPAERDAIRTGLPLVVIRNVPEPATIGLLALGMLGLIRRRG